MVYTEEIDMREILDMAEAHLLNVQGEVRKLEQEKLNIEEQMRTLNEYLLSSVNVIKEYKESLNPINTTPDFTENV